MGRARSSYRHLDELFASSPLPIYVLDDRRKILYCNPSCCEWLGVGVEELVDSQCDYAAASPAPAAALCPPPECFLGQSRTARVVWRRQAGVQERCVHFFPLGSNAADCVGVFAVAAAELLEPDPARPDVDELASAELHRRLSLFAHQQGVRFGLDRLVGQSAAMAQVRAQIRAAARSQARVTIVGPPGTGREHVARIIHQAWSDAQADSLLTPLACPLLDEELFAMTVAAFVDHCRETRSAQPATLLLLDIDQLGAGGQLGLRALCDDSPPIRFLATSRCPLLALAGQGVFDRQLAYHLSTLTIELPPLSARREDIPYLAQQLLENWNAQGGRQMSGFVPEVLDRLMALPWSRNVDELAEVVAEACRQAGGVWIKEGDLPERVRLTISAAAHPAAEEPLELDRFLEDVERELIWRALKRAKGNKSQAARLLGINRPRLLRRIEHLKLDE